MSVLSDIEIKETLLQPASYDLRVAKEMKVQHTNTDKPLWGVFLKENPRPFFLSRIRRIKSKIMLRTSDIILHNGGTKWDIFS